MPVVTKITLQKRRKDLANIFLDGRYSFSVLTEDVFRQKIKVGDELGLKDAQKLQKSKIDKNIFDSVLNYSSIRPHSQKEITRYLITKKQSEPQIKKILTRLTKLGIINDEAFADWLVNSRQKSNKGQHFIRSELFQKGIDKLIIEKVINNLKVSEETLAQNALEKKLKLVPIETLDSKARASLLRYLVSKGFSYNIARKAIDLKLKKV